MVAAGGRDVNETNGVIAIGSIHFNIYTFLYFNRYYTEQQLN